MKRILTIISLPLLFMSCDALIETRELDLKAVLRVSPELPYQTSETDGDFVETRVITASDVRDDLEDLEINSVKEVNISSISVSINSISDNEAQFVALNAFYEDDNTARTAVFSDYVVDLASFEGSALVPVTGYELSGINLLSDKLFDILQENDLGSFTLILEGNSTDANGNQSGEAIFLVIDAEIEAEAIFTEELEVPSFP